MPVEGNKNIFVNNGELILGIIELHQKHERELPKDIVR